MVVQIFTIMPHTGRITNIVVSISKVQFLSATVLLVAVDDG